MACTCLYSLLVCHFLVRGSVTYTQQSGRPKSAPAMRYVLPANARFAEGTVVSTGGDGLSLAVPVTSGYDDSG